MSSNKTRIYQKRINDEEIASIFAGLPAVMLVGPRASGKTTTARQYAQTVVRLDREAEAAPFRADPDSVLRTLKPPVLLDEWQLVPEVLASVKRAIDDAPQGAQGKYLLTGSVRAELLEATWAATGRVVRLTQWGLCERELAGTLAQASFFDRILDDGVEAFMQPASSPLQLAEYIDLALRGGFPDLALQPNEAVRRRWLAAYLEQLLLRDAQLLALQPDPALLRRYLVACAANTAGVPTHKTLYDAAGVSRVTAQGYDTLLELLFVTEQLPAWHHNRLSRLTKTPKRLLTEPAMMGPLLGINSAQVLRNGELLGRLLESFVASQLRPEIQASQSEVRLHHFRDQNGRHEVDFVAEYASGQALAIEVKATAAPKPRDAQHLAWLMEQLPDIVLAGIVFHTGPRPFRLGERLYALPIAALWQPCDRSGTRAP